MDRAKQADLPLADGEQRLIVCDGTELQAVLARLKADGHVVLAADVRGARYTLSVLMQRPRSRVAPV